jgi:hypothetical protein
MRKYFLIEIEKPGDRLFTNKLTPANKLQTALGQIHDWNEWISNNKQTFFNTTLKILKESPRYPQKLKNGNFTYWSKKQIESLSFLRKSPNMAVPLFPADVCSA